MPLTPEQLNELKTQLRAQVQHLPEEQKAQALQQIESLSPQALEAMLMQQSQSINNQKKENKTIFRMIVDSDIESVKIEENSSALAVLDINPISQAHTLIIPKKPVSDATHIPTQAFTLAKKLAKKITSKLKASSVEIIIEKKFGEAFINLLPSYESPVHLGSPRTKSSVEELEHIARFLRPEKKLQKLRIKKKAFPSSIIKLPRRIP